MLRGLRNRTGTTRSRELLLSLERASTKLRSTLSLAILVTSSHATSSTYLASIATFAKNATRTKPRKTFADYATRKSTASSRSMSAIQLHDLLLYLTRHA